MFQYQRQDGFKDALERDGQKLEQAYRRVLNKNLDVVINLVSPRLYVAFEKGATPISFRSKDDNPISADGYAARFNAGCIRQIDECFAQELDKRVLSEIGYNSNPWMAHLKKLESQRRIGQDQTEWTNETKRILRGKTWKEFVDTVKEWYRYFSFPNAVALNFLQSYQQYKVSKIRTDQVSDLDRILSSGQLVSEREDGVTYIIWIEPDSTKVKVSSEGRLELKGTSRFVTAPLIVLPESVVIDEVSKDLASSDIPPYLPLLIHEFHHFLIYAIQRHPTGLAAVLLENFDKLK
ncbi:hypothetical protein HYY70_05230 [Candidatus Woesearchaeota archaeon]|nr:hypothetical protein [Candidatus Woesearchaeota archaeon]